MAETRPTARFEDEAERQGYRRIAGVDEAGRGPLAGPVVAAAVVLPSGASLDGLRDSKQLTARQRAFLFERITRAASDIGIGIVGVEVIDRVNILEATRVAMGEAIAKLSPPPDYLLLDALALPDVAVPQRPVVRGDTLSVSIAAASIVAKVTRDRLMAEYHRQYPQYNFLTHKGYATRAHIAALACHGPCAVHRKTFRWRHLVA